MKAIVITEPGKPQVLQLQDVVDPQVKDDEVLIRVLAIALNRADTLQKLGSYFPPSGSSPYPGLEWSGTIESVGKSISRWKVGDQVCALLSGGGYAEKVVGHAGQIFSPCTYRCLFKGCNNFPESGIQCLVNRLHDG